MSFNDKDVPTVINKLTEEITALLDYNETTQIDINDRKMLFRHISSMVFVLEYYGANNLDELKRKIYESKR